MSSISIAYNSIRILFILASWIDFTKKYINIPVYYILYLYLSNIPLGIEKYC